jgi:hypothetical protein
MSDYDLKERINTCLFTLSAQDLMLLSTNLLKRRADGCTQNIITDTNSKVSKQLLGDSKYVNDREQNKTEYILSLNQNDKV